MSIIVNVPFPPSVNNIWRSPTGYGRTIKSEEYRLWLKTAFGHWMQVKSKQQIKHIIGPYRLEITLTPPDKRRRDIGNYEKALSDFLQAAGIVEDDHWCEVLHVVWDRSADATPGARLVLVPC